MTTASIIAGDVFELEADECAQTYKADRIGDNDHPIAFQHAIDDPAAYAKSEDHKHFERQIVSGARVPTFLQLRKIRGQSCASQLPLQTRSENQSSRYAAFLRKSQIIAPAAAEVALLLS